MITTPKGLLNEPNAPQEGYESRHVVYCLWKTAMLCMSRDIPLMDAAHQAILTMHLNAMAVTEVIFLICDYVVVVVVLAAPPGMIGWVSYYYVHCFCFCCCQVPAVAHSFLTRGVHMGALIMTCVAIQDLRVPIIPIDDLCDFFSSDQVLTI